jgi:ACS family hexuronate transporter-like MFS transporter
MAGVAAWLVPAQIQKLFGWLADRTGSFDAGLAMAGLLPLLAIPALWLFWRDSTSKAP